MLYFMEVVDIFKKCDQSFSKKYSFRILLTSIGKSFSLRPVMSRQVIASILGCYILQKD